MPSTATLTVRKKQGSNQGSGVRGQGSGATRLDSDGSTHLNGAPKPVNGAAKRLNGTPKSLNGQHLNGAPKALNGAAQSTNGDGTKGINGKHVNGVKKQKKPARTGVVKKKRAKRAADPRPLTPDPRPLTPDPCSPTPDPRPLTPDLDRRLIDRALAQEPDAWDDLYYRCHQPLLAAIRAIIGSRSADPNLVDELAARVWYAVVREDAKLLNRFDPARGCSLTTYLALLAKDEASRLFRSEKRRRRRETAVATSDAKAPPKSTPAPGAATITLAEFAATLTPAEKTFYDEITVRHATNGAPATNGDNGSNGVEKINGNGHSHGRSQANEWQLNHRVRRKLERFLTG
jgi:DNA-directed RNA polymerase specialized sigma24 family protein